jgi:GTP-binding protein YchF
MKACLTGFEKTGKTTLFNALTCLNIPINLGQTPENIIHEGVAIVEDPRIKQLSEIFKPKKTTFATIKYIDLPGISKNDQHRNQKIFENIKDAEVLIHIVRAFEDDSSTHPLGEINIERDIKLFESELLLFDYLLVEKRIDRITNNFKRGLKENQKELELFQRMKEHLDLEKPLRELNFSDEDSKLLLPYKFISNKPIIHVVNYGENMTKSYQEITNTLSSIYKIQGKSSIISLCATLEQEISELPNEERNIFLRELNISEPASNLLIRESYSLLGFISFFTVGEDEVRAWTIKKGMTAKEAGGKIHSDIEKGFIRAEVISYSDFINIGSLKTAKEKGLLRLEGKNYIVEDGDIMNFRFNV